jgi:uncharacterized protein YebE (UPF0316 family)
MNLEFLLHAESSWWWVLPVLVFAARVVDVSLGTFVGLVIEQKLALGTLIVRVITQGEGDALVMELRRRDYRVTCIDARGATGKVNVIFTVIRRSDLPDVLTAVRSFNPQAFYTVEDVRSMSGIGRGPI